MASTFSDTDGLRPTPAADHTLPDQHRAPLGWLLLALIPGYWFARFGPVWPIAPLLAVGIVLLLGSLTTRRMAHWAALFLCGTTLLAWSWARLRQPQAPPEWEYLPPREVIAEARVIDVYAGSIYPDRQYALIEFTRVDPVVAELKGERAFSSLLCDINHPPVEVGAVYRVQGVLHPVELGESDNFSRFLETAGAFFRLRQGVAIEERQPPPLWRQPLSQLKEHWSVWLTTAPPERRPQARLLGAMLLGERALLSADQRQVFLLSGTMHLFAISGLHVMIVALTLQLILQFLPLPRKLAFAAVLMLLFLYVGVTGFSPSALRAFSMIAFYWLAGIFGRSPRPLPAVLASAAGVLLIAPNQLYSAGFQLSYSVVLSILLLGLPLSKELLHRWPLFVFILPENSRRWQRFIRLAQKRIIESLCISLSATIGSSPLIVLHFGVWTPGAILLNALLVPLASLIVAIGVLIVLWGTFGIPALSLFFAHGAWLILATMEAIVNTTAIWPGVYAERVWMCPDAAYGTLGVFLLALILIQAPATSARLRPLVCYALPIVFVLSALWLFSVPE